jgi:SAM-dependent methyltransferase
MSDAEDTIRYNKERWEELARANVAYSQPFLDLDAGGALRMLDPDGMIGEVKGKRVLCLASGGGQQSAAFALLGAEVTVFDLSETQLERDRIAAAHYGVSIQAEQGDMRDLSRFEPASFDLVYHAYSINFVPDVRPVHREVARVLQPGGLYRMEWFNPFVQTVDEASWNGEGYLLKHAYVNGRRLTELFPHWDVADEQGVNQRIASPHEYVHALSAVVNSLAACGFVIFHAREDVGGEEQAEPGSWAHFVRVTAPYLTFWTRYRPDILIPQVSDR